MRDCHVYILYVLTNGAPWPSGWLPEVDRANQTWPRGQPRNRRLKDPDDVGAVLRDPFPYINARIIKIREQSTWPCRRYDMMSGMIPHYIYVPLLAPRASPLFL